ncbi:sucrose-specific PTS transporter subunit IIBC [Priestia aryabhattai]|uniref:sucrose-specific PTS transporter subunit IIBC n=1 Tax=Priestia aryabhattai TaxID=412384 RepID=UPI003D2A1E7E
MTDNQRIAKEVLEAIGGRENIASFAHCATRLRIMVNDKDQINQEKVENIDKVKGAFFNSGQFQIIFGTGTVNRVFEEVKNLGIESSSKEEVKREGKKQGNAFQRAIRTFGDVFVPIIPVLVATGLFMGLRGLLTQDEILSWLGLTPKDISPNFLLYTQVLTDTAFAFLPALVAWSAFRVFGGSPVLGIVLGLMLVNPALPNAYAVAEGTQKSLTMFGFIPVVGYQGSVLPAFFIGLIGAKFEKALRKRVPEALDLILTPFITLAVMITLGLFAIGPIFHSLEEWVLTGTTAVLNLPYGIAGLLIGFFHQIIVVTGVHHIFNFLEIQLLEKYGSNPFNAIITAAMAAQGAACLAVGLKTKNKKLKALALPSSFSAFLGITEPAIFGVNLRFMKPFIMGLIGGAVGGFLASLFGLKGTGMAVTVIPGTLLYLNDQLFLYILVNVVAMAVSFTLTWLFGYKDETKELEIVNNKTEEHDDKATNTLTLLEVPAPIKGEVLKLEEVPDPVFAQKQMGEGVAIQPSEGKVYAPFDSSVGYLAETKHAIFLEHESGAQLLIHVGIDTVNLKGEGFTSHIKTGDKVKAGQLIMEFDLDIIEQAGLSSITPIIIPSGVPVVKEVLCKEQETNGSVISVQLAE